MKSSEGTPPEPSIEAELRSRRFDFGIAARNLGAWFLERGIDWRIVRRWLPPIIGCTFAGNSWAELKFDPYLAGTAIYDSNIFALSSATAAQAENNDRQLSDMLFRATGGAKADYLAGRQEVDLQVEGRNYEYDHFQRLDHNEYLLNGILKWALGSTADGTVNAQQDLRIAPFIDRDSTELAYTRNRAEGGTFHVPITPEWSFESDFNDTETLAPLENGPDFKLRQASGKAAVKYLGVQSLAAGTYVEYLKGDYIEQTGSTRFDQITAELTADYTISGLSVVGVKLGYTGRSGVPTPGLTGSLSYSRSLSGKTSADAQIFRRVTSYTAGADSLIETGGGLGVDWKATSKIVASLRYDIDRSDFQNQGSAAGDLGNRKDTLQQVSLLMIYKPWLWLSAEPYLRYQNRDSNIQLRSFDELVVGLQIHGRFGGPNAILAGTEVSDNPY